MDPVYYHVVDPVENFQIRVTVRETSRSRRNVDKVEGEVFSNDIVVGWQEKVFGPTDIADYLRNKQNSTGSASRRSTRAQLQTLELDEKAKGPEEMIGQTMLYTYIDRDNYTPEVDPVLQGDSWAEPYIGKMGHNKHAVVGEGGGNGGGEEEAGGDFDIANLTSAFDLDKRGKKLADRERRQRTHKSMHICLATDVDMSELKKKQFFWSNDSYTEHILCSLKLYDNGLLEVDPGFSGIVEETRAANGLATGRTIFMGNETVSAGVSKGFQLATFRVRTKYGGEYEYAIQNMNDLHSPREIEEAMRSAASGGGDCEARASRISEVVWKQDPPAEGYSHTLSYFLNIESVSGFEGEKVFVVYQVKLPRGWNIRTGDVADGVNESDVKKAGAGDLLADDGFADGADSEGMLQGITQVGQASVLPLSSRGKKGTKPRVAIPTHLDSCDEPTRIVLGLGFLLSSASACVLGPGYPLWIVPCLVMLFVFGFGSPSNTTQTVPASSKTGAHKEAPIETLTPTVVALGHLVNLSFDVSDEASRCDDVPRIVFQVYRHGAFGRVMVEGYGYMDLPAGAGSRDHSVSTWRPEGSINQRLFEFFIGGMNTLYDPLYVAPVYKSVPGSPAALNRFGLQTVGSGSIHVHSNVLYHDPSFAPTADQLEDQSKAAHVRRTVDEILSDFRGSQSLSASRTSLLGYSRTNLRSGTEGASSGGDAGKNTLADAIKATREATDAASRMALERARERRALGVAGTSEVPHSSDSRDGGKDGDEASEPLLKSWD
jgi:hypothetical protein